MTCGRYPILPLPCMPLPELLALSMQYLPIGVYHIIDNNENGAYDSSTGNLMCADRHARLLITCMCTHREAYAMHAGYQPERPRLRCHLP